MIQTITRSAALRFIARLVKTRCVLSALILLCASVAGRGVVCAQTNEAFGLEAVVKKARVLSEASYRDPRGEVPEWLLKISYDQMRDIRFMPAKSYWRNDGLPFELQFFHPGLYVDRTVKIHEVTDKGARPIAFSPELFVYEKSAAELKAKISSDLGFAGFRIHYPINTLAYKDEVAVFLGASYFRAVAQGMQYGLSARGLAVDTAQPSGEEFPYFREFWVKRPGPQDTHITVYALLDGPRVTGAYSFVIIPGKETLMEVACTLFLRKGVDKLGIAPMTSMFFYGENMNQRPKDLFRPEIHDSDGLMIHMDYGEWIWRPLSNPHGVWVNAFQTENPQGFGLIQRDLNFDHYQDLEARYDYRPSLWCTPTGKWGRGWIELVHIPVDDEIYDNIVAYWRPASAPAGQPLSYAYTLSWHYPDERRPPAGRVVATRTESAKQPGVKKYVVDFEGGELKDLAAGAGVEGAVEIGSGARLLEQQVYKNTVTGGWRLVFLIQPEAPVDDQGKPRPLLEMRAFLKHGADVLTETWSYAVAL